MTFADELKLHAERNPAWAAVLAVYLAGLEQFPDPFTPRKPTPRPPR